MKVTLTIKLKQVQCKTCDVIHAIPETLYESLQEYGGFYFCPNGHQWGWREGSIALQNKSYQSVIKRKDEEIEILNAKIGKQKLEADKVKRRIANGVCPCCGRTFKNLARHIGNKHPEYKESCEQGVG